MLLISSLSIQDTQRSTLSLSVAYLLLCLPGGTALSAVTFGCRSTSCPVACPLDLAGQHQDEHRRGSTFSGGSIIYLSRCPVPVDCICNPIRILHNLSASVLGCCTTLSEYGVSVNVINHRIQNISLAITHTIFKFLRRFLNNCYDNLKSTAI